MIRDFENEKEGLFAARELKEAQEQCIVEQTEKIRNQKTSVFNLEQKHTELRNEITEKQKIMRDLEQDVARMEVEIDRKNQELNSHTRTKEEVEANVEAVARDILRQKEAKLVEEENVRRVTNQNELIKQQINEIRE